MEENNNLGKTLQDKTTIEMEDVIREIVDSKTKEVNDIVHKIRELLNDETTELSDQEIEDIILQLPIVLYDAMEEQEIVGLQLDMATQIQKEAYSKAFKLAQGTIKDKEATTDLQTRTEQLEKIIFDRSYKIIKQKFEMAVETLNAVKKVLSLRQQKYEMGSTNKLF